MARKKPQPPKPTAADLARARATMRALGVSTLYGTGDGAYFRSAEAAAAYNGHDSTSLITYLLD